MLSGEALSNEAVRSRRDALMSRVQAELGGVFLEGEGRAEQERLHVGSEGAARTEARGRVVYEVRYAGQSFELGVEEDPRTAVDANALREVFAQRHEERYGYRDEDAEVELVTIRVSAWGQAPDLELASADGEQPQPQPHPQPGPKRETREVVFEGSTVQAQCLRGNLPAGTEVAGPAICALAQATLWVPPGWSGKVDAQGTIGLRRD